MSREEKLLVVRRCFTKARQPSFLKRLASRAMCASRVAGTGPVGDRVARVGQAFAADALGVRVAGAFALSFGCGAGRAAREPTSAGIATQGLGCSRLRCFAWRRFSTLRAHRAVTLFGVVVLTQCSWERPCRPRCTSWFLCQTVGEGHGDWVEGEVSLSLSGEGEGATDGLPEGEADGSGDNRAVGMMGKLAFPCPTLVHPETAGAWREWLGTAQGWLAANWCLPLVLCGPR